MYIAIAFSTNSIDSDQTPQNAVSDQGLRCLPLIQQFLNSSTVSKIDLLLGIRANMPEQSVYTEIRRHRKRRLIRIYTVCKA